VLSGDEHKGVVGLCAWACVRVAGRWWAGSGSAGAAAQRTDGHVGGDQRLEGVQQDVVVLGDVLDYVAAQHVGDDVA
jgi:hypothetical protein